MTNTLTNTYFDDYEACVDHRFKLLMLGDAGVGKTSLTRRFVSDNFCTSYIHTIGIDFLEKVLIMDGERVRLQIWDTAGQERFRSLIRPYYRGASGIVLVYDVTDNATFEHMKQWMVAIEENTAECQVIQRIIVANKCDLRDRSVTPSRGQALASNYNSPFFETSAKDGTNVNEAFVTLAKRILEAHKGRMRNNGNVARSDRKESFPLAPEVPVHPRKEKRCCWGWTSKNK